MLESTSPQPDSSPAADSFASSAEAVAVARVLEQLPARAPARTRKVAILGFGQTVKDCPWQDPSWELWAMNGFWRAAEPDYGIKAAEDRYTLWLDMHSVEYTRAYGKAAGFGDAQEKWLEQPHPFPILMLDEDPAFPSVHRFPIEDLVATLGRDYFTSTVAYAIAFALAQADVAEIALFGIDLTHGSEYEQQRPCAEYWVGRAEAAGIKVVIHEGSALLKQRHRYGYEGQNPLLAELRTQLIDQMTGITAAVQKNTAEAERLRDQLHTDDGALQAVRAVLERLDVWERGGRI